MKLTVSRLELYPADAPTGWAVGFVCECSNGTSFYTDTVVSHEDAVEDSAAVDVALNHLGDSISQRCAALEATSSLLGSDVTDKLSHDEPGE